LSQRLTTQFRKQTNNGKTPSVDASSGRGANRRSSKAQWIERAHAAALHDALVFVPDPHEVWIPDAHFLHCGFAFRLPVVDLHTFKRFRRSRKQLQAWMSRSKTSRRILRHIEVWRHCSRIRARARRRQRMYSVCIMRSDQIRRTLSTKMVMRDCHGGPLIDRCFQDGPKFKTGGRTLRPFGTANGGTTNNNGGTFAGSGTCASSISTTLPPSHSKSAAVEISESAAMAAIAGDAIPTGAVESRCLYQRSNSFNEA